jgi:hypothetical protein
VAQFFAFFVVARAALLPLFRVVADVVVPAQATAHARAARVERWAGQLYKLLWHSFVTFVPLVVLRGNRWWPPGFAEDPLLVFEGYPDVPPAPWVTELYLLQIAYYIHATLVTVIETRDRPNFAQMCVHHSAVLLLLVVSLFIQNNAKFGIVVSWLHDVCDVPVCLTRLTVDLPLVAPVAVCYVLLMGCFVFFRLIVLPKMVLLAAHGCFASGVVKSQDAVAWWVTTPLLCTLVVLHIVWFFELVGMFATYFRTGQRTDSNETEKHKAH